MAKGLFYWYFENKEALFAELVRSIRQQLRRAQAAAMDPDADPLTRLRQGAEASVRFMAEHVPLLRAARGRAQRPAASPRCCGRAATSTSRTRPAWCRRPRQPAWSRTTTTRRCSPSACSARSPSSRTTTAPVGSQISIDELAPVRRPVDHPGPRRRPQPRGRLTADAAAASRLAQISVPEVGGDLRSGRTRRRRMR